MVPLEFMCLFKLHLFYHIMFSLTTTTDINCGDVLLFGSCFGRRMCDGDTICDATR